MRKSILFVALFLNTTFGKPTGFITPSGVFVPRSFSGEFGAKFTF